MARTPFASSTPTSFSSRPGNSAVTLTSLSVSLTSMFGHPTVRSNRRSEPNGVTSKPRKTSSNARFISRCSVRKGFDFSPRCPSTSRPRFHGMRSLIVMVISPFWLGLAKGSPGAAGLRTGTPKVDRSDSAAGPLRSGRLAVLDLLAVVAIAGVDRNPARLHGLRQLAHQLDLQEPVFKRRACHLDIVGEVELAPERTSRDALEQVVVITVLRLAAFHGQHVLLCRDGDLLRLEAGQIERDAIVILTDACDVVGRVRVIVLALQPERIVDEVKQAIETDGRPPDGGEIEVSHSHILHLSNMDTRGAQRAAAPLDFADPRMGDRRSRFRWPAFAVKRGNDDRDGSVPIAGSRRPLLGITAAVRATAPAFRFLHPADVVGLPVKFLQGIDHFIKLHDATGSEDLPQLRHRFDGRGVRYP